MSHARVYVFLFLIYPLTNGLSQEYRYVPFPDSNAIWSEVYYPGTDAYGYDQPPVLERFAIPGGDTIIDTLSYKKLYIFYDTIFDINKATCIGGIREDTNKRIYFKGDKEIHNFKPMNFLYNYNEITLFDFSLSIGDTIKNINCRPEDDLIIVDDIDTVVIGNSLRKLFSFKLYGWVKWIEGIGNLRGLLFTSGDIFNNGLFDDLICFKQNDTVLYLNTNYPDCIPVITSIEIKKNEYESISAYPNPAAGGIIEFFFGENDIETILILDGSGQILDIVEVYGLYNFAYSVEKYKPGIYLYKTMNKKGILYTGKFIVK